MVHLIYGSPGSGKSTMVAKMIADRLAQQKKVILLVPERYTVSAERAVYSVCGEKGTMDLEVLSFKRLCNRVFREYGGLCYNYAGKGCRTLMMYRALLAVRPRLSACKQLELSDKGSIFAMLDSIVTLKRGALTPEMLNQAEAREELSANPQLREKLKDLSLIWQEYDRLLKERYDDPEEDLERLCALLSEHDFFRDKEVFLDSTAAYSGQELAVLRHIMAQSPSVTVTLGFLPEDGRAMTEKLRWCLSAILKTAEAAGAEVMRMAVLDEPIAKNAPELIHLEKQIFGKEQPFEGENRCVFLNRCSDPYKEAQAIAGRILRDVQNGGRFFENGVILRNSEDYKGIIDSVFEANGIPYTMAGSIPFSGRTVGRMILSLFRMYRYNLRLEDLFAYMKTGFSGLEDGECFLLEEYANLWHIEGKRWLSEKDFAMNPEGHTGERTGRSMDKLYRVNLAKEKLMAPVRALFEDIAGCKRAEDLATALFEFLTAVNTEEKLRQLAESAKAEGKAREAQWHSQTFSALCDILDELVYAMGDKETTPEEFSLMLEILFDKRELGAIPEGRDRVLISDVFGMSPVGLKNVYIPGMNDGIFPATVTESGMFREKDLALLKSVGIDLPGGNERAIHDEEYLVYSGLTLAFERLYVSTFDRDLKGTPQRPSSVYRSLLKMFKSCPTEQEEDLLYGNAICLEYALSRKKGIFHRAMYRYFERQSRIFEENIGKAPLVTLSDRLSPGLTEGLYGSGPMGLSQTKLETFINCPFSYSCKYVLGLKESKKEDTGENEIGSVVHGVLEQMIENCVSENRPLGSLSDEEIASGVARILESTFAQMLGEGEENSFLLQLKRRIGEGAKLILCNIRDEFSTSLFQPAFCELPFGMKAEGKVSLPAVTTKGEYAVTVKGAVDRVDCYRSEDGRAYIRIVDYKTGKKVFHPEAIKDGLNLQMLIYLRALRDCKDPDFLKGLGIEAQTELLPAGVEYYIASKPNFKIDRAMTPEEIRKGMAESIKRSGWVVDEGQILQAFGGKEQGYLPGNKDCFVSMDIMNEVLDSLDQVISEHAERIRTGIADATPRKKSGAFIGCAYCEMRPVCRNRISGDEEPS